MKKCICMFLCCCMIIINLPVVFASENEIIARVGDSGYRESDGKWRNSGLLGYNDEKSRYVVQEDDTDEFAVFSAKIVQYR